MAKIPERMRGLYLRHRIKGIDGGKGYRVHSGFFFERFVNNKPEIKKVMIKVRPQNSLIDMMVKESNAFLNWGLKNGGSFDHACNLVGKSGFVGIVCNFFKENINEVTNNEKMVCPDLQLDPHFRVKSSNVEVLEVFDEQNKL